MLDVDFDKAVEYYTPQVLKNALLYNDKQFKNEYISSKSELALKLAVETEEISNQDSIKLLEKYVPLEKDYIEYLKAISE